MEQFLIDICKAKIKANKYIEATNFIEVHKLHNIFDLNGIIGILKKIDNIEIFLHYNNFLIKYYNDNNLPIKKINTITFLSKCDKTIFFEIIKINNIYLENLKMIDYTMIFKEHKRHTLFKYNFITKIRKIAGLLGKNEIIKRIFNYIYVDNDTNGADINLDVQLKALETIVYLAPPEIKRRNIVLAFINIHRKKANIEILSSVLEVIILDLYFCNSKKIKIEKHFNILYMLISAKKIRKDLALELPHKFYNSLLDIYEKYPINYFSFEFKYKFLKFLKCSVETPYLKNIFYFTLINLFDDLTESIIISEYYIKKICNIFDIYKDELNYLIFEPNKYNTVKTYKNILYFLCNNYLITTKKKIIVENFILNKKSISSLNLDILTEKTKFPIKINPCEKNVLTIIVKDITYKIKVSNLSYLIIFDNTTNIKYYKYYLDNIYKLNKVGLDSYYLGTKWVQYGNIYLDKIILTEKKTKTCRKLIRKYGITAMYWLVTHHSMNAEHLQRILCYSDDEFKPFYLVDNIEGYNYIFNIKNKIKNVIINKDRDNNNIIIIEHVNHKDGDFIKNDKLFNLFIIAKNIYKIIV